LILLLALLTRIALGAPGRAVPAAPVLADRVPSLAGEPLLMIDLGPSLAARGNHLGWAFHAGIVGKVDYRLPLYVGGEATTYYWNGAEAGMAGMAIAATALWHFDIGGRWIRPYAGASLGTFLRHHEGRALGVSPTFSVRPGLLVAILDLASLSLEPRFGLLDGEFVFQGQANAVFSL
jgi:hypothetical protein